MLFAIVPFIISIALATNSAFDAYQDTQDLGKEFPDRYKPVLDSLSGMEIATEFIYLGTLLLATGLFVAALVLWHDYEKSRSLVRWAFVISFAVPFLIYLGIPYRAGIDSDQLTRLICKDAIDGRNGVPGLRTYYNLYPNVTLSSDVCDKRIDDYGKLLTEPIDKAGYKPFANGSCPNSLKHAAYSGPAYLVPLCDGCAGCFTSTCFGYLAMASLGVDTTTLSDNFGSCSSCAVVQAGLGNFTCFQACASVFEQKIYGNAKQATACFPVEGYNLIESVGLLVQARDALNFFVGSFVAYMSVKTLLPIAFSMIAGSIKAYKVVKTTLPFSRIVGWAMLYNIAMSLPLTATVLALLFQVVGDWYVFFGNLLFIGSLVAWLSVGKKFTPPQSHKDASKKIQITGLFANLLKVSALVLYVLWAVQQNLTLDVEFRPLEIVVFIGLKAMDYLGKANLTTIFYVDMVMQVLVSLHHYDSRDPYNIQKLRDITLTDMESLTSFAKKEKVQYVELGDGNVMVRDSKGKEWTLEDYEEKVAAEEAEKKRLKKEKRKEQIDKIKNSVRGKSSSGVV